MITYIIHAAISIFAVMNPIGNVPIFLSLTSGSTQQEQRETARKGIIVAFMILTIFLVLGRIIFDVFGITVAAFRVAGGIIIFGIAYNLLHARRSHSNTPHPEEQAEGIEKEDVSVTPLATPLIAGPGAIATVMALSTGDHIIMHSLAVFIGYVVVLAATYVILYYSGFINRHLGKTQMNVITRLMGLLLAVVAIQMAVTGFNELFPGWIAARG